MKLATLNDGTRDGQLMVVARDLKTAHLADGIAATLQRALDDWAFIGPQLDALYQQLNQDRTKRSFDFDSKQCMAPLPRAYQAVAGVAHVQHLEWQYKARGEPAPAWLRDEPVLARGAADQLAGPHDDVLLAHEAWGIDFEAGLAAITGDVAMGATPDQAHGQIRLLMLVNNVALRHVMADELVRGGGPLQARPALVCSPVAVTPDELDEAWKGGKVHLPLRASWNGKLVGQPNAGADNTFNFPQLIAHLSRTRAVRSGTIVGAGPVANKEAKRGYACIADKRALEQISGGTVVTPYLRFDDLLRFEMLGGDGKSVFGAIEHSIRTAQAGKAKATAATTAAGEPLAA
jgi:fumarylacetoacetate (FAA) hydrolase